MASVSVVALRRRFPMKLIGERLYPVESFATAHPFTSSSLCVAVARATERNMSPSKIEKAHAVRRGYGGETARRWRSSGAYVVASPIARRADRRPPLRALSG